MAHSRLVVFDPAMCCSPGVRGTDTDPELARFAADLKWLGEQGVEVERHNLAAAPGAFARMPCVKEALEEEGTQCLPILVVDGAIVSRGVYPQRAELAGFLGLGGTAAAAPADSADASTDGEVALCGPGCDCGPTARRKGAKLVVSLAALALFLGAMAYRGIGTESGPTNSAVAGATAGFSVPPAAPTPPVDAQSEREGTTVAAVELRSFNELDRKAADDDVVFVYIPGPDGRAASDDVSSAMTDAESALSKSGVALGRFALRSDSSDYVAMRDQVKSPSVLVAIKGGGAMLVSDGVTDTKLLQAYVAAASAGCGPSGCGPSGCN